MKRVLLLTKRNFTEALALRDHINLAIGFHCDISIENINKANIDIESYDLIWMFYYPTIVKNSVLARNPKWINTHPSFLPYGKGSAPNFFDILRHAGAGATVHIADPKLDDGDIIRQESIEIDSCDTGESLYIKTLALSLSLSIKTFNTHLVEWIHSGVMEVHPQIYSSMTTGTMRDFHRERNLNEFMELEEVEALMDRIRASTFDGHEGAYFTNSDGEVIEIKASFRRID